MADHTKIEWADATWNPITGCSMVSAGCANCYAMQLAGTRLQHHPSRAGLTRESGGRPVWTGEVRLNEDWLDQPLRWRRPRKIFVCAHGDLFYEGVPDEWIDRVFAVMALSPQHTFQVLTKRPERMRRYFEARQDGDPWAEAADEIADAIGMDDHPAVLEPKDVPLPNVWLGVSVEDQVAADARRESMAALAAAGWRTFVSHEPALGPVNWAGWGFLSQVICGGESGPRARPMHPDWARVDRDWCAANGVPFFFKQWGNWSVVYDRDHDDPDWRHCPESTGCHERYVNIEGGHGFHGDRVVFMRRLGKKAAGRHLDGRTWDQMPDMAHDFRRIA